jgi:uncharacterized protein YkwD
MSNIYKIIFIVVYVFLIVSCAATNHVSERKNTKAVSSTGFEKLFLSKVNFVRSKARKCGDEYFPAAPALILNHTLSKAAHNHSQDMSKHQFLEHTSSNGDTLVERMRDVNYLWGAVGENIAHNQNSIGQVIEDWLTSPGHCSNMMFAGYTQTGVANVNKYWTQVYATPK